MIVFQTEKARISQPEWQYVDVLAAHIYTRQALKSVTLISRNKKKRYYIYVTNQQKHIDRVCLSYSTINTKYCYL